jgi:hypothetical protein
LQKHGTFCEKVDEVSMRESMENKIKNGILEHGSGWCFSRMHFADLEKKQFFGIKSSELISPLKNYLKN